MEIFDSWVMFQTQECICTLGSIKVLVSGRDLGEIVQPVWTWGTTWGIFPNKMEALRGSVENCLVRLEEEVFGLAVGFLVGTAACYVRVLGLNTGSWLVSNFLLRKTVEGSRLHSEYLGSCPPLGRPGIEFPPSNLWVFHERTNRQDLFCLSLKKKIFIHIYIYICTHTHTHTYKIMHSHFTDTSKKQF